MAEQTAMAEELKSQRHRSPNYPAVGLREAVERVRKLYETDGRAGAPPEIAAKHIGYSSAHGAAMSTLAALRRFGLVVDSQGRVAPSQRAIEILNFPESDTRRLSAIREAALEPPIYRELVEKHQTTGFPADDVLQAELIADKAFNPKAVPGFVRDFKETLDFAGINVKEGLDSIASSSPREETKVAGIGMNPVNPAGSKGSETGIFDFLGKSISRRYPLDISIPRGLKAELAISGEFKKEDLDRLKKQINRLIENLEDAFLD